MILLFVNLTSSPNTGAATPIMAFVAFCLISSKYTLNKWSTVEKSFRKYSFDSIRLVPSLVKAIRALVAPQISYQNTITFFHILNIP